MLIQTCWQLTEQTLSIFQRSQCWLRPEMWQGSFAILCDCDTASLHHSEPPCECSPAACNTWSAALCRTAHRAALASTTRRTWLPQPITTDSHWCWYSKHDATTFHFSSTSLYSVFIKLGLDFQEILKKPLDITGVGLKIILSLLMLFFVHFRFILLIISL